MYSLVAFFQSVFMVGTTSPPDARSTDTMPDIPDANKIEPRITFDFGANCQRKVRFRENLDAIVNRKKEHEIMRNLTFIQGFQPLWISFRGAKWGRVRHGEISSCRVLNPTKIVVMTSRVQRRRSRLRL
jgi:hypothetical protein